MKSEAISVKKTIGKFCLGITNSKKKIAENTKLKKLIYLRKCVKNIKYTVFFKLLKRHYITEAVLLQTHF